MYKVVGEDIDLRKVQIDETWKEVNERVELGELKWGDKVAIVAVDGEEKVVAGRVDRVGMGGIWTSKIEKTSEGYKAQIEGANIELPEGYSYKYVIADKLGRVEDGKWLIDEYYEQKMCPADAVEFTNREISFKEPKTLVMMIVDSNNNVCEVHETYLGYINVETDDERETFKVTEAMELPVGYSYGYYLYNEGDIWWDKEGKEFEEVKELEVGKEISSEGKDNVAIYIIKDGKIVRNLIGYRVNIPRIIDAQLIYNDNNFIEANINEGEIVLDLTNLNDTDVIKEISLNSTKVKEVRINLGNEQFILDMYNGNNVFTPAQLGLDPQNDGVKIGTLRNALNILNESGVLESGDMLVLDAELIDIYDNVVKEISIVIKVNN